jgi:hypothetical protein
MSYPASAAQKWTLMHCLVEEIQEIILTKEAPESTYRINWFIRAGIITLIRVFNRIETTVNKVIRCLCLVFSRIWYLNFQAAVGGIFCAVLLTIKALRPTTPL